MNNIRMATRWVWIGIFFIIQFQTVAVGAAPASKVRPIPTALSTAKLIEWSQQLSAAQKPAIDVFNRCQPVNQKAFAAVGDSESWKGFIPQLTQCSADMETAVREARDNIRKIDFLPRNIAEIYGIRPQNIIDQYLSQLSEMASALSDGQRGLEAIAINDMPAARLLFNKARSGFGAALDAQLLMLETVGIANETILAGFMFDLRKVINRSIRIFIVTEPTANGVEIGDDLRAFAAQSRSIATRARSKWTIHSQELRRLARLSGNSAVSAKIVLLDEVHNDLDKEAFVLAALLESAPYGTVPLSDISRLMDGIAQSEIRIVGTTSALGAKLQKR